MPRDGTLLDLDMAPRRPLRVILEDLRDLVHPAHVQLCSKVDPGLFFPFFCRVISFLLPATGALSIGGLADETTVFGAHTEVFDVSEVEFQKGLVATGNDVDDVARVAGKLREGVERAQRRNRHRRCLDDRREGTLDITASPSSVSFSIRLNGMRTS